VSQTKVVGYALYSVLFCPVEARNFMRICTGFHTQKTQHKMLANGGINLVGFSCMLYGLLSEYSVVEVYQRIPHQRNIPGNVIVST
jgi:hypothetical protein